MKFYWFNMHNKGFIKKLPGVDYYPGDFDSPPPLVSVDIEVTHHRYQEQTYTGYYLPAGQEATIKVRVFFYLLASHDFVTKWKPEQQFSCWSCSLDCLIGSQPIKI